MSEQHTELILEYQIEEPIRNNKVNPNLFHKPSKVRRNFNVIVFRGGTLSILSKEPASESGRKRFKMDKYREENVEEVRKRSKRQGGRRKTGLILINWGDPCYLPAHLAF